MTRPAVWTRRDFVAGLLRVAVGLVIAAAGGWLGRALVRERRGWEGGAQGFFSNAWSARVVGQAYLRARPAEADRRRLAAEVGASLDAAAGAARSGRDGWREAARHRVREDFEAGRVVKLEGWILSLTEARLCALAALGEET